jgi:CspA family cold shock protein
MRPFDAIEKFSTASNRAFGVGLNTAYHLRSYFLLSLPMNTTAKRITISIISSIAVFLIAGFIQNNLDSTSASLATFVVIFIGVSIAAFTSGASTTRARSVAPRSSSSNSSSSSSSSNSDAETGSVKWFNVKKGYGFITRDSGDDVFVHYRNIVGDGRRSIADGPRVQFVVVDGDKGLQADEVEAI